MSTATLERRLRNLETAHPAVDEIENLSEEEIDKELAKLNKIIAADKAANPDRVLTDEEMEIDKELARLDEIIADSKEWLSRKEGRDEVD